MDFCFLSCWRARSRAMCGGGLAPSALLKRAATVDRRARAPGACCDGRPPWSRNDVRGPPSLSMWTRWRPDFLCNAVGRRPSACWNVRRDIRFISDDGRERGEDWGSPPAAAISASSSCCSRWKSIFSRRQSRYLRGSRARRDADRPPANRPCRACGSAPSGRAAPSPPPGRSPAPPAARVLARPRSRASTWRRRWRRTSS
mmetsp:Transcript_21652/g.66579  ORF Transcript_21652/g.66579 Transcript_21652/m.66579 type:complete len:201 (+) Transcript_21652:715-1317(+)